MLTPPCYRLSSKMLKGEATFQLNLALTPSSESKIHNEGRIDLH
jgi:hypothetical protein